MNDLLDAVVANQKAGGARGVTSVCSAHPLVLRATLDHAVETGGYALIEATSNQVDQTGGYTGMTPADFHRLVATEADRAGLPMDRVTLGGDHLGPNRWRDLPAEKAMRHAEELVACYVAAGFTKIHLDCSYSCADDPRPLPDTVVAARAARLAVVAEQTAAAAPDRSPQRLRYVVGTEVPTPGGADHDLTEVVPTAAAAARETLRRHREAFAAVGLTPVWPRVSALVVQPGVEFDQAHVVDYDSEATDELRHVLDDEPDLVFEAHSTDYQTPTALAALVHDHWAVLKVGPGLTFALREALFALVGVERELLPVGEWSHLPEILEHRMRARPEAWQAYHHGDADQRRRARRFSYSDRVRYYWSDPDVALAVARLLDGLAGTDIPLPLLRQFLPLQYERVRRGVLGTDPTALVLDRIRDVLRDYDAACTPREVTR